MKKILVCSNSKFFEKKIKKKSYYFISNKNKLNLKYLKKIKPYIIFFPHWNHHIKKNIFDNYNCIGFHSTPLPYGRGGSPVQNMIIRNKKNSVICAYKITKGIDVGPVYLRKKLSLNGSGNDIFLRIYITILKMMSKLEKKLPIPVLQKGKIVYFKRRKHSQSNLLNVKNIREAYNLIRMLDIDFLDYPKAFIAGKNIKLYFKNAKYNNGKIDANVKILRK